MRKPLFFSLSLVTLLFLSCGPKIILQITKTYPAIDYSKQVTLFKQEIPVDQDYEKLGEISLKDTGFTTRCSYSEILNRAKLEALKVGGDAIQINQLIRPDFFSGCFRLEASILKLKNK